MNVIEKYQELVSDYPDCEILEIYKTGSQVLHNNPGDLDYMTICKNYPEKYKRFKIEESGNEYDLCIKDIEEFKTHLNMTQEIDLRRYNYFYLSPYKEIIYGKEALSYDIFDKAQEYKTFLKELYQRTWGKKINTKKATKGFVHFYIPLKIFANNSIEFTQQMKDDIEILYDNEKDARNIVEWIEQELEKYPGGS